MAQTRTTLLYSILFLLILNCSGRNKFTADAIQKDITAAVSNYNSEDWEVRLNSVKSISKYSNTVYAKNSLLLLLLAIDDSHSEVRIETIKILKTMKATAAEEKLAQISISDENSNVRFFSFSALEEYGNIKYERLFIKGLEDKDWLVQEAALKCLMKINDLGIQKKHLAIILNAMKNKNVSIKLTAILNISIEDPLIYNEFARIINNKDSGLFILKAVLQKIKGYKLDIKTKKRIIELLTHRDKNVRLLSLQALKQDELNIEL